MQGELAGRYFLAGEEHAPGIASVPGRSARSGVRRWLVAVLSENQDQGFSNSSGPVHGRGREARGRSKVVVCHIELRPHARRLGTSGRLCTPGRSDLPCTRPGPGSEKSRVEGAGGRREWKARVYLFFPEYHLKEDVLEDLDDTAGKTE